MRADPQQASSMPATREAPPEGGWFWPGRFTPEPRVVDLPAWRTNPDGSGFVKNPKTGVEERLDPIFVSALESLRAGLTFAQAAERADAVAAGRVKPNHVRIYLRQYYYQLHRQGSIVIPFEDPPEIFVERYRWIKELGRGGIGIAHLCEDLQTKREVVVKHAWGYRTPAERSDKSMRREGEVMRAFDHPGIVPFIDEFEHTGLYHLVRGFADGRPLQSEFRTNGASPEPWRALARQAADIMTHIHARGYLLLDANPANFVLQKDGSPLLIDVGVCRSHENGRATYHTPTGARGYAAPEVIEGRDVTILSDVYAFGCLAEFLLTGKNPVHNPAPGEREARLASAPERAREVVLSCTKADPAQRPRDMAAVLALLDES